MHYDNNTIQLLISPRYRGLRHFILFTFILFVAMNFIGFMEEDGTKISLIPKLGGIASFIIIFLGGCYLNIYILTPRLLLKNKLLPYFLSLFAFVVTALMIIIAIQTSIYDSNPPSTDPDNLKVLISMTSSVSSFVFFFAGTATFVLLKQWILDMQRAKELESATMQLELRMLENQINPHFLFNMLNNANIMIKKDPDTAVHIINKLEEMLRYQMDESGREKVSLQQEILFLRDFLELEKTRRDFFDYTISEKGIYDEVEIPPLLFITFVENAVKHNQDSQTSSFVHISFEIDGRELTFVCENSIPQKPLGKGVGGIGLANIKRRLNLLFMDNYSLEHTMTNSTYTVKLVLKL